MDLAKLEAIAKEEIDKHLNIPGGKHPLGYKVDGGWKFKWTYGRRQLGVCYYGPKLIKISKDYARLNDEPRMRNTLMHEIAHAIVGHEVHHGYLWQRAAKLIGADGHRLANSKNDGLPLVTPPRKNRAPGPVDYSSYNYRRVVEGFKKFEEAPKICNPVPVMV
jgi:hypothetical protein